MAKSESMCRGVSVLLPPNGERGYQPTKYGESYQVSDEGMDEGEVV